MPEYVPAGIATNAGQPVAGVGKPAIEYERVPNGIVVDTTTTIAGTGAPARE